MKEISIDPKTTPRAQAFELWMNAPNPMVTFFKTLDVSPLVRLSRRRKLKFNMLLCWCVGKAASGVKEFFLLPVGRELFKYDSLAVNTIVKNKTGEVSSCDVPFNDDIQKFNRDYLELTSEVAQTCRNHDLAQSMVIGTSAIIDTEIDGAVGMNSGIFNNPFIIWGKYRRRFFRTTLTVSFQFHHTQMDGAHAGKFLELLQRNIRSVEKELGKKG
ncbi:CatA-like O-acetyltransferase, family 2 [uncultured Treponema sp.]|uniref:CatA-like O-acetyltransferase, family 2 n=1 Tax=uncultured Treponema sp. TaxID=162155 RepID=UPI002606ACF2|nr:CatA-like O-acetyltransferase, family 2 [uncultured Treponema sp.]